MFSAVALPAQPVDATQALNLSAGVSNCKVSRGRSLSRRATLFRAACECTDKSVPFWKVLSQQAIGVLVRPALPRALRIAKIDIDVGRHRKAPMIRQFLAPVPGH